MVCNRIRNPDVRWDDYTITNDAIWTGRISLKEKAVLASKKSITLTQNLTVVQPMRDSVSGLFAPPTVLVCEGGSEFLQESGSFVSLVEGSSIVVESGSEYRLEPKAKLKVDRSSKLVVRGKIVVGDGAKLIVKSKKGLVIEGGEVVMMK